MTGNPAVCIRQNVIFVRWIFDVNFYLPFAATLLNKNNRKQRISLSSSRPTFKGCHRFHNFGQSSTFERGSKKHGWRAFGTAEPILSGIEWGSRHESKSWNWMKGPSNCKQGRDVSLPKATFLVFQSRLIDYCNYRR